MWGSLASCGRLVIGQLTRWREMAVVGNRREVCQPAPRRQQGFYFLYRAPVAIPGATATVNVL